ncbi:hypothetical protein ACN47E_005774 [Coniothyrium glycines]
MASGASVGAVQKRGSATTVKACDLCRKRKRRCIWTSGLHGCTPCTNLNETCTTTHVRKQRSTAQRGRITDYENRIKTLESLLQERNAAQPQIDRQPLASTSGSAVPVSTWVENLRHEVETMPRPPPPTIDPFALESRTNANAGLLSLDLDSLALENYNADMMVSEMTLPHIIDELPLSINYQAEAALLQGTMFSQSITAPDNDHVSMPDEQYENGLTPPTPQYYECDWYLPPPEVGTSLLAEYLTDFNTAFPIYQPHVIAEHLRVCYAGESDGTSVAWTSAYVVFGLAHMLRAMSTAGTKSDNDMAQYYLSRIYHGLSGLLTAPPSQGLVQCLLGVATLIMSTPCHYNLSEGHFISTALRVMQGITYQDGDEVASDSGRDVEQERRVFWLAFIYDTSASIMTNSLTTHKQEDINHCVSDIPPDGLGSITAAEGHWQVNMFTLCVKLAILQAEAIDQVVSLTRNRNATPLDIEAAAVMVLTRLEMFHGHEIFRLGAGQLFEMLYRSDICHVVNLEATFFSTVYRIYAFLALGKNPKINPFLLDGLQKVAGTTEHKSYKEAKRLLSLLSIAPRGDIGLYWRSYRTFTAALVTVLAYHINNVSAPAPARVEMQEYNQILGNLSMMLQNNVHLDLAQTHNFCVGLYSKLETRLCMQGSQQNAPFSDERRLSALG